MGDSSIFSNQLKQYKAIVYLALAIASYECWCEIVIIGSLLPHPAMALDRHAVFFLTSAITMFFVALGAVRFNRFIYKRQLFVDLGIMLIISSVLMELSVGLQWTNASGVAIASACGGVASTGLFLLVLNAVCRLEPFVSVLVFLAGFLFAFLFMVLCYAVSSEVLIVLAVVLPVVLCVSAYNSLTLLDARQQTKSPRFDMPHSAWKVLFLVAAIGFLFSFKESAMGNVLFSSGSNTALGSALVYAVFFFGFSLFGERFAYVDIVRIALPITAIIFLFLPTELDAAKTISDISGATFFTLGTLYSVFTLFVLCSRYNYSSLRLFGLVYGARCLGTLLGNMVFHYFGYSNIGQGEESFIVLVAATMVLAYVVFLIIDGDAFSLWTKDLSADAEDEAFALRETLMQSCKALAAEKGLTAREEEICFMLAQGKTLSDIQEDLCLAVGTMKTHRRNIYAKCGVHSREDLLTLVQQK